MESHQTADEVEAAIAEVLPGSDVVVHVEPRQRGLELRDRVLSVALSEPLVREAHDITIFEEGDKRFVSPHLKLPADLSVRDAHEVSERIERRICDEAGVAATQTHLEPLEHPLVIAGSEAAPGGTREMEALVARYGGVEPAPFGSSQQR